MTLIITGFKISFIGKFQPIVEIAQEDSVAMTNPNTIAKTPKNRKKKDKIRRET